MAIFPLSISNRFVSNKLHRTPVIAAANHNDEDIINRSDCIDTIRLFSDSMDFSEDPTDGWISLMFLLARLVDLVYNEVNIDKTEILSPFIWLIRLSAFDIKDNLSGGGFALLVALSALSGVTEVTSLLSAMTDNPLDIFLDARWGFEGYFALHILIAVAGGNADLNLGLNLGLNLMINKGANLHSVGHHPCFSVKSETPTSLAMYSSFVFMEWRNALLRSSVDLASFVEEEVQQAPLKEAGWTKDLLLALLCCNIQSDQDLQEYYSCEDCSDDIGFLGVDLSWRQWLDRFREKTDIENSPKREHGEIKSDRSNGDIAQQKPPSLLIERNFVNEFGDGEEIVNETATSDVYEGNRETEAFDAYFGGTMGFVCMRCYVKRQGYGSDIWSQIGSFRGFLQSSSTTSNITIAARIETPIDK